MNQCREKLGDCGITVFPSPIVAVWKQYISPSFCHLQGHKYPLRQLFLEEQPFHRIRQGGM